MPRPLPPYLGGQRDAAQAGVAHGTPVLGLGKRLAGVLLAPVVETEALAHLARGLDHHPLFVGESEIHRSGSGGFLEAKASVRAQGRRAARFGSGAQHQVVAAARGGAPPGSGSAGRTRRRARRWSQATAPARNLAPQRGLAVRVGTEQLAHAAHAEDHRLAGGDDRGHVRQTVHAGVRHRDGGAGHVGGAEPAGARTFCHAGRRPRAPAPASGDSRPASRSTGTRRPRSVFTATPTSAARQADQAPSSSTRDWQFGQFGQRAPERGDDEMVERSARLGLRRR
jgi:hypothetical protein